MYQADAQIYMSICFFYFVPEKIGVQSGPGYSLPIPNDMNGEVVAAIA